MSEYPSEYDSVPEEGWRKSDYSADQGACVEVASGDSRFYVRDSRNPDGTKLVFSTRVAATFLAKIVNGAYDQVPEQP